MVGDGKTKTQIKGDLMRAAVAWWKGRRPIGWTLEQHLENPTINTSEGGAAPKLAEAVAALVARERHRG